MSTTATTALARRQAVIVKQERALGAMNPELRKKQHEAAGLMNKAMAGVLDAYRKLGALVLEVTEHPERYHAGAVELLAESLEWSPSTLYKARAFHDMYTDEEYKEFAALRGPDGKCLTWSHLVPLLQVQNKKLRLRLQQQAAKQGLTADNVEQMVREHIAGGENRRPGSGRRFAKPKTLFEGIRNFGTAAGEFQRRLEQVVTPMLDDAAAVPPESIQPEALGQVDTMVTATEGMIEVLTAQCERARQLRAQYRDALAARGELPDDAAANDDEEDDET